mgnify:CR=1 FL=1
MADANTTKDTYGIVASFTSVPDYFHAVEKVRDAGFSKWDCYTPCPVHGLDDAMGLGRSKVPIMTLCGGLTGFTLGTLITWYMNGLDYPLIVGGKPIWSPVFPFPVMYELTILLAAFGTLGGMFLFNMLPRHHHPMFEYKDFAKSSDDTFLIVIENTDPAFNLEKTSAFLREIGGSNVETIEA